MFGSSTQMRSWTFKNEQELQRLRKTANEDYVSKQLSSGTYGDPQNLLSSEEELTLVREYVRRLREFCSQFRDPRDSRIRMPVYVTTVATHYLLRFFLYNSVMDHHPKHVMHTCIYLACKIEEFYVTITDYVHNVPGSAKDKERMASMILNSELQTTQELQFHLIVHQPYRPLEGLLIDLKARYEGLQDAEALRGAVELFLEKLHLTDAPLLYAPSQLALAAVTTAASKLGQNLDSYVTDILFRDCPERLAPLVDAVRKIKRLVKAVDSAVDKSCIDALEKRLSSCLNPLNDPTTEQYWINQARIEQDDDDFPLVSSSASVDNEAIDILEDDVVAEDVGGTTDPALEELKDFAVVSTGTRKSSRRQKKHQSARKVRETAAEFGVESARSVLDGGVIDDNDCIIDE